MAAPARLQARTLAVAYDGTAEYATLVEALDAAQPGDIVTVKAQLGRLGIALKLEGERLIAADVLPLSGAEAAGMQPRDQIVSIDGQSVRGLSVPQAVDRMRGESGAAIGLDVLRSGWTAPQSIRIVRTGPTYRIKTDHDKVTVAFGEQDWGTAFKFARPLAEKGDSREQMNMGYLLLEGKGVAKNIEEALSWYRKAAKGGELAAQSMLGISLLNGNTFNRTDEVEAAGWLRQAADRGDQWAQNALGWAYASGKGVAPDREQAVLWYRKAIAQGNELARKNLEALPPAAAKNTAAPAAPPPALAVAAPPVQPASPAPAGVTREEMRAMLREALAQENAPKDKPARVPASDVDSPRYRAPANPDNFALVIGVESYSDLPEARFAERDAAAVRGHLAALGYPERNIVSVLGPKATKTAFIKNLETWLPKNVKETSTVFVYFSGHGAPDPKTGRGYLMPWDGDPQFLEDSAYPLKRLYDKLGALKARGVVVALDACFSGTGGRSVLASGTRPLVTKVDVGSPTSAKIVSLTASESDQTTGTDDEQGHGLFTYYLLRGLNGEAAGPAGSVTAKSLFDYLAPRVADEARRKNRDQTPQIVPASAAVQEGVRFR